MSVLSFCANPKFTLFGAAKCGKCKGCLRLRTSDWVQRASVESEVHERTWFLTLTYRGDIEPGYSEFQKFMKRIRKNTGVSPRYLVATERGSKTDRLHLHVLVHCSNALTKRMIQAEWKLGITHMRLTKDVSAKRYVAKYASKDGRIRASVGYGTKTYPVMLEQLKAASPALGAVFEHFPNAVVSSLQGMKTPYKIRRQISRRPALTKDEPQLTGDSLFQKWIEEGIVDQWGRHKNNPFFGIPEGDTGDASPG